MKFLLLRIRLYLPLLLTIYQIGIVAVEQFVLLMIEQRIRLLYQ
jgi:hypothetical protein